MTTTKKLQANLENAKKSTGPKSETGRAASSRNALKHGLAAEKFLLGDENPEEFEALHAALREALDPVGLLEEDLVARITMVHWSMRRSLGAEKELMSVFTPCDLFTERSRAVTALGQYDNMHRRKLKMLEAQLRAYQALRSDRASGKMTEAGPEPSPVGEDETRKETKGGQLLN